MNLLFTRSQAHSRLFSLVPLRIGGNVTFKLKTELELTDEEQALLRKYSLSNASLIYSNSYDDLARAFRPAWLLGLITAVLTALFLEVPVRGIEGTLLKIAAVPSFGLLAVIIMTVIYFFALRRNITVAQLTNGGRTFYCHSVVELDEQEEELLDLGRKLEITLQKAKNWGGREINPLPFGDAYYLPDQQIPSTSGLEKSMHAAGAAIGALINQRKPKQSETVAAAAYPASDTQKPQIHTPSAQPAQQTPATQPSTKAAAHPFAPQAPNNSQGEG